MRHPTSCVSTGLGALVAAALLGGAAGAPALTIGGFDLARGGIESVQFGSDTSSFRAHVTATFPGATFSSTGSLTAAFLAGIDVLVISAVKGPTTAITLLSAAEKTALWNFVAGGGSALLLTDNNVQFEPASDSMVGVFGLDATGAIPGSATATVVATHPVTSGPFGTLTSIPYAAWPGWYASLGAYATPLATLDANGQVSLAVIDFGALGPGSGAVIFFSDATIDNVNYTGATVVLVDNALAYALPAPGPAVLLALALGVLSGRRRGRWISARGAVRQELERQGAAGEAG
jgi:hypothetical protein